MSLCIVHAQSALAKTNSNTWRRNLIDLAPQSSVPNKKKRKQVLDGSTGILEGIMPRMSVYFGLPLLVTILFMFALRPLARGMGLIDRPGGRKMHIGEVPVIGGLAMVGGFAVGALYS